MPGPTPSKRALLALLTYLVLFLGGCGGGSGSSTTPPPPPSNTNINVSFANNVFPTAVAEQINAGTWAVATVPTSNPLTITLPAGTTNYGLAYVCPPGGPGSLNNEYVIEATIQDGTSYALTCVGDLPTGSITGTVVASAFPTVSYVEIAGVLSQVFVNGNSGAIIG